MVSPSCSLCAVLVPRTGRRAYVAGRATPVLFLSFCHTIYIQSLASLATILPANENLFLLLYNEACDTSSYVNAISRLPLSYIGQFNFSIRHTLSSS